MYKLSAIMSILIIQGCGDPQHGMETIAYRVSGTAVEKRIEYYDDSQEFQIEEVSSQEWQKVVEIERYEYRKAILRVINLSGTGYVHTSISSNTVIRDSTTSRVIALVEYDV